MAQDAQDDTGARTCFVMMPYGTRDVGPTRVDFDRVYETVLKPAIRRVRLDGKTMIPRRADESRASRVLVIGMIRDLLRSRLAIADITIENENVSWELGMRHLRVRSGTVLLWLKRRSSDRKVPFDYSLVGVNEYADTPPAAADAAISSIASILRATLRGQEVDSPAFLVLGAQGLAGLLGSPEAPTKLGEAMADAELARMAGKTLEAASLYSTVVALAPDQPLLHQRQGILYMQAGDANHARASFEKVVELEPRSVDARRYLADLRLGNAFQLLAPTPPASSLLDGLVTAHGRLDAGHGLIKRDTVGDLMNVNIQSSGLGRGQYMGLVRVAGHAIATTPDAISQVGQICERHGFASRFGAIDVPEVNGTIYAFGTTSSSRSALESAIGGLQRELNSVAAVGKVDIGGKLGGGGSGGSGGGFGGL